MCLCSGSFSINEKNFEFCFEGGCIWYRLWLRNLLYSFSFTAALMSSIWAGSASPLDEEEERMFSDSIKKRSKDIGRSKAEPTIARFTDTRSSMLGELKSSLMSRRAVIETELREEEPKRRQELEAKQKRPMEVKKLKERLMVQKSKLTPGVQGVLEGKTQLISSCLISLSKV